MYVLPGASLGVLGGGQLGRMFVTAARVMGYRTVVFDSDTQSPAGRIADQHVCADYDDTEALRDFAERCEAATIEFENVPFAALEAVAGRTALFPAPGALEITQDRVKEKTFLNDAGIATTGFQAVAREHDVAEAWRTLTAPLLLKTARLGYDGKGQREAANLGELQRAFADLGRNACIAEEKVAFKCEVSVILARSAAGRSVCYPPAENEHRNGILHTSTVPARCGQTLAGKAADTAVAIADALDYRGVLAVEFFVTEDDELLVNEIAPRPHNSGHFTIDACASSQFEQQVRIMCGFPPAAAELLSPVTLVNILGDVWNHSGGDPHWNRILSASNVKLHLYGKDSVRPGRKMGHFCVVGTEAAKTREQAQDIFTKLVNSNAGEAAYRTSSNMPSRYEQDF